MVADPTPGRTPVFLSPADQIRTIDPMISGDVTRIIRTIRRNMNILDWIDPTYIDCLQYSGSCPRSRPPPRRIDMAPLPRRQVIKYGAAGAVAAPLQWTAPSAASAVPAGGAGRRRPGAVVPRAGRHRLAARAAVGNGRLGAMVFGNAPRSGCSSTRTPSGPAAPTTRATPAGADALPADPAAGLRRPVGPGPEPHRPDHARHTLRPARLPDRRRPRLTFAQASAGPRSTNAGLDLTTATAGVSFLRTACATGAR